MSSTEDEIAQLEKRLAELKEAEVEGVKAEEAAAFADRALVDLGDDSGGFDFTTLSSRKKVTATKGPAPEELLSESWKEADATQVGEEGGLPIVQVAGGLLLAVALVAFSQVPVGSNNMDPATYGGVQGKVESAAQIKARYEALGGYTSE